MTDRNGVYKLLRLSAVYEFSQYVLRPWHSRARFVERHLRPTRGARILDLGCGTASILRHFPAVEYVGLDSNPAYVRRARELFGTRGTFHVADICHAAEMSASTFDVVLALGVLHHLDDAQVAAMLGRAAQLLRPGGRFVSHDPVWADSQSYWSRWWVALDRGQHVRSAAALLHLATPHFASVSSFITHDSLRIPYSEIILECDAG